ncbi:MFS transporter [Priestia megaterium]|jgi:DHA1 family putative efflux transporter-like MFS transporter|uniref:MFS transporter n=1 Tax=Priestia TaxID=2800373 RepID=UPI000BED054A|nr:MFS transporter [Priestia megaterium]PEB61167.1 MFS transporter [Priestia megaterium]PEE73710.1 MFS transporter [Priestia megaterium]PFI97154.1 MFS transporter [Priestia megaterium]PGR06471.1 MFS transporter [Priestia megaterium]
MSNTAKIYILALISFLVGTSQYIISGILDKMADALGVSIGAAGQLITVFSLAYAIGTPILMVLTSKMERRKLLIYTLFVFIVGNLLSVIVPGYGLFMIARIIMALSTGVAVVTVLSIAAKIAPANKKASSIATVVMGFTASLIIGVPIGRFITSTYGWKFVFIGIALLVLFVIFIVINTIPKMNGDASIPLKRQIAMFKKPKIALALSITFFLMTGYAIIFTYLSPFLVNTVGMSDHLLSITFLVLGVASLFGSKLGGLSADKKGVIFTLKRGLLVNLTSLVVLVFISHSNIAVFIILTVWSFAAWSSGATQQYNLATISPESSDVLLGLNQSMMQLGFAFGAGLGGVIVGQISLSSITWFSALSVVFASITTFGFSRFLNNKKVVNQDFTAQKRA